MRSTIALIFVLICVAAVRTVSAANQQCMCACCAGAGCKPVNEPCFDLIGCQDDTCTHSCKVRYPVDCGSADSTVQPMCMPAGDPMCMSAASQIFNRYTTLGAFILVFIATAMFRIWLFSFLQWCIPRFFLQNKMIRIQSHESITNFSGDALIEILLSTCFLHYMYVIYMNSFFEDFISKSTVNCLLDQQYI